MESIQFRSAKLSDVEELHRLVNSAYRGDSSRVGWTTEADFLDGQRTDPERLQEMIDRGVIVCAFLTGELVGCVYLERQDADVAYLGMLTIKPDLQAQGLGRRLLTHAEEFARNSWQASHMRMQVVHVRDSLLAWYERRGYQQTGETKPFPYHDIRSGVPLRDGLKFLVLEKALAPCP